MVDEEIELAGKDMSEVARRKRSGAIAGGVDDR